MRVSVSASSMPMSACRSAGSFGSQSTVSVSHPSARNAADMTPVPLNSSIMITTGTYASGIRHTLPGPDRRGAIMGGGRPRGSGCAGGKQTYDRFGDA